MSTGDETPDASRADEDFTAYSVKIIEYLCKRHKMAGELNQATEFDIEQIWTNDLKAILGGEDSDYFRDLLYKINSKTGYLEIRDNKVRLAEGKKTICEEVGITLD
jgi:hypothetical protein